MKGVVFTEFQDMVEDRFGVEVLDRIIQAADLDSDGAYTAVGTYDHTEMLALVSALSEDVGAAPGNLVKAFGQHLWSRFVELYPAFFAIGITAFDFLSSVEDYIHVEVRKLYPDAELPRFTCERDGDASLSLVYESSRPFADLAEGLIAGCLAYFGEDVSVARSELQGHEVGTELRRTRFHLTRNPVAARS